MGVARDRIREGVSSLAFSALCFVVWGALTGLRAHNLGRDFSWMELAWVVYNSTIAVLFLVRTRPTAVSLNPIHWLVALLTSFSGLFFEQKSAGIVPLRAVADILILLGLVGSGTAALALRRSYDFLPALRGVTTDWLFRFVRHPMYLSSIVIRLGYLARHASAQNVIVFSVMLWLYIRRAKYEEEIMQQDERYAAYMRRVPHRFLPGVY